MKMRLNFNFLLCALLLTTSSARAQPPRPELGTRWMLNTQFSDEFNGSELDLEKWYDYHPGWKGRPPAIFLPSQVSVKDGYLQIKNGKLDSDTVVTFWDGSTATYTIAGGAVVSRTPQAHYGYYECSQKASRIRMSSTFWMTTGKSYPGPDPCDEDRFGQELDIQEAVGGADGTGGDWKLDFRDHMHSNSHYNYTDCDGVKEGYSRGAATKLEKGEVSDTFHVYAAHWKDATQADVYLDHKFGANIKFRTDFDDTPFHMPMQINMVTETYDWMTPPSDEDLANDEINTTYIDWVRSWKQVEVDFQEVDDGNLLDNPGFESGDFTYWTGWGGNPREVVSDPVYSGSYAAHIVGPGAPEYELNLRSHATYTLSCYGKIAPGSDPILFGIKQSDETVLGSVQVTSTEFQKHSFSFTTGDSGLGLKFYFYAPKDTTEGWADDFSLVLEDGQVKEAAEAKVFDENLRFSEGPLALPSSEPLSIPVLYQCNGDRVIILQLRDADSILVSGKTFPAYEGYGHKELHMAMDPRPAAGNYILSAEIRHPDSTGSNPLRMDFHHLLLEDPVDIEVKVVDKRLGLPLSLVSVRLGELEEVTKEDGKVSFTDVPAGSMDLSLEKPGYEPWSKEDILVVKDTLMECILEENVYQVTVGLADGYSAGPIAGATVYLGDSISISNIQGRANFQSHAGSYEINATAPRYHDARMHVAFEGAIMVPLEMHRSLADVKFVVQKNKAYLKDATVIVGGQSATTSDLGIANFSDLTTGEVHAYSVSEEEVLLLEDELVLQHDSTVRLSISIIDHVDQNDAPSLHIYPNPAGERIQITGLLPGQQCSLLSADGRVLRRLSREEASALKGSMNLQGLSPGYYLLRIEGKNTTRHHPIIKN